MYAPLRGIEDTYLKKEFFTVFFICEKEKEKPIFMIENRKTIERNLMLP